MTHDWSADLIAPDEDFAGAPLLRKEFALDQDHGSVVAATLFVTAHGIIERGEIPHTLIGQRKRVKRNDARTYLQQHSFGAQAVLHDAGAEAEALLR